MSDNNTESTKTGKGGRSVAKSSIQIIETLVGQFNETALKHLTDDPFLAARNEEEDRKKKNKQNVND